jgi:hypothetical protein
MAKPLTARPPSSAVARLFDEDAAVRAAATLALTSTPARDASTAAQRPTGQSPLPGNWPGSPAATGEPATIKRELVLTPAAEATLIRLVAIYRQATGTKLTTSHVARAVLHAVATCLPLIEREATNIGRMPLPSNAKGREAERDSFERRLAQSFHAALAAAYASDLTDR